MKLAIGTAQFGLNYGIANDHGKVSQKEVKKILDLARGSNISLLDTAMDYGDSEFSIGKAGAKDFNIVTKIGDIPTNEKNIKDFIFNKLKNTLDDLGIESLYGLLLHRPENLLNKNGIAIYETLSEFKEMGLIEKIGISIYEPNDLDKIIPNFELDIIQSPINIFDRRLINSFWANELKKRGVEIHARSIFLQGLLLIDPSKRPTYFKKWNKLFKVYDEWLYEKKISNLEVCIRFVLSQDSIDNVIIGIDSCEQLKEIIDIFSSKLEKLIIPNELFSNDKFLLNPPCWKL